MQSREHRDYKERTDHIHMAPMFLLQPQILVDFYVAFISRINDGNLLPRQPVTENDDGW